MYLTIMLVGWYKTLTLFLYYNIPLCNFEMKGRQTNKKAAIAILINNEKIIYYLQHAFLLLPCVDIEALTFYTS